MRGTVGADSGTWLVAWCSEGPRASKSMGWAAKSVGGPQKVQANPDQRCVTLSRIGSTDAQSLT